MRLGLDIGTNSIGWWLYATNPNGSVQSHIDGGVRIFSDGRHPKSGQSLAVARREARSARKRRDRYLRRRADLMKALAQSNLMPNDPDDRKELEKLDPYALRAVGLNEKITLNELGRALFHLNQRRGFKSNRKTDGKDNEGGKIKEGSARLDQAMMAEGAKTYGEFLHKSLQKDAKRPIRTRLGVVKDEDGKEVVYDEGKRFTGNLITTYSSKKTVKQMYQLKNGELTGIESSHKGEKTIRHITTMSGQKLRLPVKDEEITKNKEIRYYDSGEVKVEGEGYLEYNSKKQRYVFIKHGKATKYDEDGIVIKEREYVKGERVK